MAKPQHISEVYASQLEDFCQGYPLWSPSGPEGADEIDIGDVGYIREGQFVELFKSKYAKDDSHNARNRELGRIPSLHDPLPKNAYQNLLRTARDMEPNMYTTKSLGSNEIKPAAGANGLGLVGGNIGYKLITTEEKAAFLCIRYKAIKTIAENSMAFKQYVKHYHSAWVEHAKNELGIDCKTRDIIIVHGFVKTVEWIVGASRGGSVTHGGSVELQGGVPAVVGHLSLELENKVSKAPQIFYLSGPEKRLSHSRSPSPVPSFRDPLATPHSHARNPSRPSLEVPSPRMPSPKVPETAEESDFDQCIFLRYFQVRWRLAGVYLHVKAGAGPHQLPRDPDAGGEGSGAVIVSDSESDAEVESNVPAQSMHTWLDILLEYILQHSDADAAIACHGDIFALIPEGEIIEDFAAFLEQSGPRIEVDEDRYASLCLDDLVVQQRERELKAVSDQIKGHSDMDVDDDDRDDGWRTGTKEVADGNVTLGNPPRTLDWPHFTFCGKDGDAGYVTTMALSPDDKLILAGCVDGTTQLWSLETGELAHILNGPHTETVWSAAFSPDGNLFATGDTEGVMCVRAAKDDIPNVPVPEGDTQGIRIGEILFMLEGHSQDITTIAFSPDSRWVASGSIDCTTKIWSMSFDRSEGSIPFTVPAQHVINSLSAHVSHVTFTPDSKRIILSGDTTVTVCNVESGATIATMNGHTAPIWSVALSHEGDRLITGSEDATSRIWDVSNGNELVTIAEHSGPVWSVAWSPDDAYVVSGSHDSTAVVCDSFTGQATQQFAEAISGAAPVTWLADNILCTGTADGPVMLWDTNTAQCIATFNGHSDKVKEVVPTHDLRKVISASDDGSIRIWDVSTALRLVSY